MKRIIITAFKITVVVCCFTYLLGSGRLDFRLFYTHLFNPALLSANITYFSLMLLLVSWRLKLLSNGMGLLLSYFRAFKLTMIGLFFNIVSPGAVGGDLFKAFYLIRDNYNSNKKAASLMSIFVDRIFGLFALFFLSALAFLFSDSQTLDINSLFLFRICLLVSIVLFVIVICFLFFISEAKIEYLVNYFSKKMFIFLIIRNILNSALMLRSKPFKVLKAFSVSLVVQIMFCVYFYTVTLRLTGQHLSLSELAFIPLGIITIAVPIAPGGAGVGHVVFERIFSMLDLNNGADVFNYIFIMQSSFSLLGFIPFLLMKDRKKIDKKELEVTTQRA